ncbi:MAG: cation:proton antiporter, partial [Muribaculaceae bacterium]|nr:cation:proton antiporter [Muribaculaceae bacterium]
RMLGLTNINSLFLGGMLSMSSTTIIIKAFTDMNLRQKKFASLVFAVLIVEDLFAVVMMVVLSSIALNSSLEGGELLLSVSKLVFFLVIWFLVGGYVLPTLLNKCRRFLNNETLLVVAMGLCLSMAVFSVMCGFSMALGAFVMGSILAGTSYAERIEHVTMPVKDLFGSVFFISVGMMVQPAVITAYWGPILLLSAIVAGGMILFGTSGMLLTGQSLRVAIESGFSLTQIGEFAFIIATLGMSLGVLNPEIYPIVVAVSVVTTFTTPYFIKLADPFYSFVERHLPSRFHFLIERYGRDASQSDHNGAGNAWLAMARRYLWRIMLYSILLLAITMVSQRYMLPLLEKPLGAWAKAVWAAGTLAAMSPFLLALCLPPHNTAAVKIKGIEASQLKVPRIVMMVFRLIIALAFIVRVLGHAFSLKVGILIALGCVIILILLFSRNLNKQLRDIESRFIDNLNERELRRSGRKNNIVSDLHLAHMHVGYGCPFVGEKLSQTGLRSRHGVDVVMIQRGPATIAVPSGDTRLFPGDTIGIIGTDSQIADILPLVESEPQLEGGGMPPDFRLTSVILSATSPLAGDTLATADVRRKYEVHVVALERDSQFIDRPAQIRLTAGDRLWVVGAQANISRLA